MYLEDKTVLFLQGSGENFGVPVWKHSLLYLIDPTAASIQCQDWLVQLQLAEWKGYIP